MKRAGITDFVDKITQTGNLHVICLTMEQFWGGLTLSIPKTPSRQLIRNWPRSLFYEQAFVTSQSAENFAQTPRFNAPETVTVNIIYSRQAVVAAIGKPCVLVGRK